PILCDNLWTANLHGWLTIHQRRIEKTDFAIAFPSFMKLSLLTSLPTANRNAHSIKLLKCKSSDG
ncbi:hypothetical protein ACTXT7_014435, partial [Hymenolepis weldensis]